MKKKKPIPLTDLIAKGDCFLVAAKKPGVRFTIWRPECFANPHSSNFLVEARLGGWLMDQARFEKPEDAFQWGYNHSGGMGEAVAATYRQVFHEKENGK